MTGAGPGGSMKRAHSAERRGKMRRNIQIVVAVLAILVVAIAPANAITGGQPDGDGHPYGALLLIPGQTFCSGTLIAPDIVLTAGHCTSYWSASLGVDSVAPR